MAFIHGEVSWVDPLDVVADGVERMSAAVADYPWATSGTQHDATSSTRCVLAVQSTADDVERQPDVDIDARGVDSVRLATDMRLHARDELAGRLGRSARDVSGTSEGSLVAAAFERWDVDCAARLLGEGTFALWDTRTQRLMCWRDPLGVRPLYYFHEPGRRFVFSSDLRSMAAHPRIRPVLDLAYLRGLIESQGYLHDLSRTLLRDVLKLRSAHRLVIDPSGLRVERYWNPADAPERGHRDEHDYVAELRELVETAVRDRVETAGSSVGSHLSGGLDSSSLAVMGSRVVEGDGPKRRFTAFSWAPSWEDEPAVEGDERHLVDATAASGSIDLRYARLRPSDLLDVICRDVALMPLHTLHYELASTRDQVSAGVGTMLSGWGGDETVAYNGRGYFAALARHGRLRTIQRELRLRAAIHGGSLRGAWKSRVLMPLLSDGVAQRLGWLDPPRPPVWPAELRPEFARCLREVEPLEANQLRERPGVRDTQLRLLEHGHLQYRMESWASHGATVGITYSFPLLDRRLVEFALGIPDHLYFKEGWKRWLYRTAMEGILPDEVRWNPVKFDDAMVKQYWRAKQEMGDEYRERIMSRADNPLVDVEILRADVDGTLYAADDPRPRQPVGEAAWLAFTELRPS